MTDKKGLVLRMNQKVAAGAFLTLALVCLTSMDNPTASDRHHAFNQSDLYSLANFAKKINQQYNAAVPERQISQKTSVDYIKEIVRSAGFYNVEPSLIFAIAWQESSFRTKACSGWGRGCTASGIMQINGSTTKETINFAKEIDLQSDWRLNIRAGTAIYSRYKKRFGGVHKALTAYFIGPTRLDEAIERHGSYANFIEQRKRPEGLYADQVLFKYRRAKDQIKFNNQEAERE